MVNTDVSGPIDRVIIGGVVGVRLPSAGRLLLVGHVRQGILTAMSNFSYSSSTGWHGLQKHGLQKHGLDISGWKVATDVSLEVEVLANPRENNNPCRGELAPHTKS